MFKKFVGLLLPLVLLAQNVVFAFNPFPMALSFQSPQAGSSFVFDLTTFTVEVTNVDGSKFNLWDDTQLIVGQNDTFLTAILYNDVDEEIDTRALNLDNPYVKLTDDGKKVVLTYNAKDLVEQGVNTSPGLYRMEIVNVKPSFEMETRAENDFAIVKPANIDTVNLQRKILEEGMELTFSLASNEENLDYLPLGYAHPDIDPVGRDYLSADAEVAIYDEEVNLLATYSGGDIKWNYDGTYSYVVGATGEYLMIVTNSSGDDVVAEFSVEELVPGVVQIGNNIVAPGIPVSVAVYDLNDKPVDLIEGYRLVVYGDVDYNGQNHLLSSDDGGFTNAAGTGNYTFVSPNASAKYSLALYDEVNGDVLSGVFFKVEVPAEAEEAFVFPGDDHVAGLADFDVDPALPVEGDNLVEEILVRCVDVEEDYWAFGLTNALLDEGMYPVVVEEGGYNCRPLTEITRKEFTTWLLKAYRPDDYALVADMDISDMEIPFPDLDLNDSFTPYVIKAAELDIIHGHPDGTFRPDLQINRAEVLKILLRSSELFFGTPGELLDLQLNHSADMPTALFSDVDAGEWYYPYLYYGVVSDIIEGYGDGTARMGQGIIFSEAAKILYLAKQLEGGL